MQDCTCVTHDCARDFKMAENEGKNLQNDDDDDDNDVVDDECKPPQFLRYSSIHVG